MSGSLSIPKGGQAPSLHELQGFLESNAGKEIRAKKDDQGGITLYARSGWKPSMRFLTKLGDMSGRTAKQDLAKETIKGLMTKNGLAPERAEELLGKLSPGAMQATSTRGKGIYIGGKGVELVSGKLGVKGLVDVAQDEIETEAEQLKAQQRREAQAARQERWQASPRFQTLDTAQKHLMALLDTYDKGATAQDIGEGVVAFVKQQPKDGPFMEKFNHITNPTRNGTLFAMEFDQAPTRKAELAKNMLPEVTQELTKTYLDKLQPQIKDMERVMKNEPAKLKKAIDEATQSAMEQAKRDAPKVAAERANQKVNNALIEKYVLESPDLGSKAYSFDAPDDFQITGGAGNCAGSITALRKAYENGTDATALLKELRGAAISEFINENALGRLASGLTEMPRGWN